RKPDETFRDTTGHPMTIDAFLRINASNQNELRAGIALSGAHGIGICLDLPLAWQDREIWDIPDGQQPIGTWLPGSWGGHSMWSFEFNESGILVDMTWKEAPKQITWRAMGIYCDEAHVVIDSVDAWRKKPGIQKATMDAIGDAVKCV